MPTVVLMKQRDKKEADLKTMEEIKRANVDNAVRQKNDYESKLKNYWIWCEDNKIEPVDYPVV